MTDLVGNTEDRVFSRRSTGELKCLEGLSDGNNDVLSGIRTYSIINVNGQSIVLTIVKLQQI